MLLVYTFVFSVVFKARWNVDGDESKTEFAIILFAGMIVFNLFAEIVNRATALITSNANYVKKVVFPLEILPMVALGSALFHTVISLVVLLFIEFILKFSLPWTNIFSLALLPLIFASIGFARLLSALGVFVRDIGQVTGIFVTILMFMSAVFYPVTALLEPYQSFLRLNPLVLIITESRKSLVLGELPDWTAIMIVWFVSLAIAFVVFWWFQKVRKEFADHEQIAQKLELKYYFAHPYAAWERGTNENTNGLLRQYFPKKTDFQSVSNKALERAMTRLNFRPRKTLRFKTPSEVFFHSSVALTS